MAASQRFVDKWVSGFDLTKRRQFTVKSEDGEVIGDLYFRAVTRADRLSINERAGTEDGFRLSTVFLCQMAELEDGTKAFLPGDIVKLQRELPEKTLNDVEQFMFELGDFEDVSDAKND
jgi:hypothetical protein